MKFGGGKVVRRGCFSKLKSTIGCGAVQWTMGFRAAPSALILGFGAIGSSCSSNIDASSKRQAYDNGALVGGPEQELGSVYEPSVTLDSGLAADSGSIDAGVCDEPGQPGCPCSQANEVVACGRFEYVSGDYVTCYAGTTRCDGTQWGTCTGNRIVAQNKREPNGSVSVIYTAATSGAM